MAERNESLEFEILREQHDRAIKLNEAFELNEAFKHDTIRAKLENRLTLLLDYLDSDEEYSSDVENEIEQLENDLAPYYNNTDVDYFNRPVFLEIGPDEKIEEIDSTEEIEPYDVWIPNNFAIIGPECFATILFNRNIIYLIGDEHSTIPGVKQNIDNFFDMILHNGRKVHYFMEISNDYEHYPWGLCNYTEHYIIPSYKMSIFKEMNFHTIDFLVNETAVMVTNRLEYFKQTRNFENFEKELNDYVIMLRLKATADTTQIKEIDEFMLTKIKVSMAHIHAFYNSNVGVQELFNQILHIMTYFRDIRLLNIISGVILKEPTSIIVVYYGASHILNYVNFFKNYTNQVFTSAELNDTNNINYYTRVLNGTKTIDLHKRVINDTICFFPS